MWFNVLHSYYYYIISSLSFSFLIPAYSSQLLIYKLIKCGGVKNTILASKKKSYLPQHGNNQV